MGTPALDGGLIDNTFSYIDNLTWQRGKHTLSLGIQALRYENNYPTSNNNGYLGSLTYSGAFTSNPSLEQCRRVRRSRFSAGPGKRGHRDALQRERGPAPMAGCIFRERRLQDHAQAHA